MLTSNIILFPSFQIVWYGLGADQKPALEIHGTNRQTKSESSSFHISGSFKKTSLTTTCRLCVVKLLSHLVSIQFVHKLCFLVFYIKRLLLTTSVLSDKKIFIYFKSNLSLGITNTPIFRY